MKLIVDTNVPIVANRQAEQATPACVIACIDRLLEIRTQHTVLVDSGWQIISEYQNKLNSSGQPGVGDAFLKWILNHLGNPVRCEQVAITPMAGSVDGNDFIEYPSDPALATFDRSDRKFVAAALAHPEKPPILNAVDTDWAHHYPALVAHGVTVDFLCPDCVFPTLEE